MRTEQSLYIGISIAFLDSHHCVIAISIRDSVYLHDFSVKQLNLVGDEKKDPDTISDHIINELSSYERNVFGKFIGAGIPYRLMTLIPKISSRLWAELDAVPILVDPDFEGHEADIRDQAYWNVKSVDEQADSMARKCIM